MFDDVDEQFLNYLSNKLGIRHNRFRFAEGYRKWKNNNFIETRGRKKLSLETIQIISDIWNEHSIPSVDCRNGRESITIRRSLYLQRFHKDVNHPQPLFEKIKRNTRYYSATRRVVTCTHHKVVEIIKERYDLSLPIGTVWAYKPFYVVYPTEKEKQLCLCKLCLNKRQLFDALRKKYNEFGDSLSGYLMGECDCPKDENGFWKLKCCVGNCSSCRKKRLERNHIPGMDTETGKITFYQFEETQTTYKSRKTGEDKISKKIERTPDKHETPKVVHELLLDKADDYLLHRY